MSCRIVVCRVALSCVISYVVSDCRMSFNIVVCRTKYFPRARHTTTWHDTRQSETKHDNLKRYTTLYRSNVAQLSIVYRCWGKFLLLFYPRHTKHDTTHDNLKRHTTMWHDIRHYIDQMSCNCRLSTGVEESFYRCWGKILPVCIK